MNQIVLNQAHLPAALRAIQGQGNRDLSEGLPDAFAVLTGRGKQFIIKHRGADVELKSPEGHFYSFLDVVILKASPSISKIYYAGAWQPGDDSPPDCWSVDGVTPDPSAASKQNPTCASCRHNVFGSKITPQGTAVKACGDSRRLVVVPMADIRNEAFGGPMMFRVPPASLKNLAMYAGELDRVGIDYWAVNTRISFDPQATYPQYVFQYLSVVNDAQAQQIVEALQNPMIARMLTAGGYASGPAAPPPTQPMAIAAPVALQQPVQPAYIPPVAQPQTIVQPQPVTSAPPAPPTPVFNQATGQWELPPQPAAAPAAPPPPPTPVFNQATGQWELPGQATQAAPTPPAAVSPRRRGRAAAQPASDATPANHAPVQAAPVLAVVPPAAPTLQSAAPLGTVADMVQASQPVAAATPAAMVAVQPAPAQLAALVGNLMKSTNAQPS